ncbi:hypothetical protein JNM87_04315 [Candidatus Saccharibacteria bacterium]|nr:hypothetical protein [Candidatus Saccharibacteria bacterium]
MDFRQSNSAPVNRPEQPVAGAQPVQHVSKKAVATSKSPSWLNILNLVILFGVTVLLVLIAVSFARSNSSSDEEQYVDSTKYQAVFLNNGQVYFGNIKSVDDKTVDLQNIFYLTQSTTTSNGQTQATGDYTLIKLGCQQIHYPADQMLINRDQVTFWENLSKDGKVTKSIEEFKKQNPNGPNCSEVSNQTQATNNSTTQGSTTPSNTTTQNKQ